MPLQQSLLSRCHCRRCSSGSDRRPGVATAFPSLQLSQRPRPQLPRERAGRPLQELLVQLAELPVFVLAVGPDRLVPAPTGRECPALALPHLGRLVLHLALQPRPLLRLFPLPPLQLLAIGFRLLTVDSRLRQPDLLGHVRVFTLLLDRLLRPLDHLVRQASREDVRGR